MIEGEIGREMGICPAPTGYESFTYTNIRTTRGEIVICEMGPLGDICGAVQNGERTGGARCIQLPRPQAAEKHATHTVDTFAGTIAYNADERVIIQTPFPRTPRQEHPLSVKEGIIMEAFMDEPDQLFSDHELWGLSRPTQPQYQKTSGLVTAIRNDVLRIRNGLGSTISETRTDPMHVITRVGAWGKNPAGYTLRTRKR